RLLADLSAGTVLRTPVSLIYHSLADVNDKLRLGRYFFMDILKDGIVLFEEPGFPFVEPMPLTREQALKETQDYFNDWFESASDFLDSVWPRTGRFEKRCYALLRDAYVKARYSPSYRISADELAWIAERVKVLQDKVKSACDARIEYLARAA
ncbi:MAG TPA: hypothetical protein PK706_25585, partial [Xanthobacteraceae bacterium]|nr:hypothetical protein [Xanthobacteraceae bacterium]